MQILYFVQLCILSSFLPIFPFLLEYIVPVSLLSPSCKLVSLAESGQQRQLLLRRCNLSEVV